MSQVLVKLKQELGLLGIGSLSVLAIAAAVHVLAIKPLEARLQRLDEELHRGSARAAPDGFQRISADPRADGVAAFYKFVDRREGTDDWLAALYGIATASGLELRVGEYRLSESQQRIERYQINLPVTGSYTQIRSFLETALLEIPVLSLDQAIFRRKSAKEGRIEADIALTLHVVRK